MGAVPPVPVGGCTGVGLPLPAGTGVALLLPGTGLLLRPEGSRSDPA